VRCATGSDSLVAVTVVWRHVSTRFWHAHVTLCQTAPSAVLQRLSKPRDCVTTTADIIVSRGCCVLRIATGAGPRRVGAPGAATRLVRPFVWGRVPAITLRNLRVPHKARAYIPKNDCPPWKSYQPFTEKVAPNKNVKTFFSPFRPVEENRQCAYIVTLGRVRAIIVQLKSNNYYIF
jgi:hypothetical protein